MKTTKKFDCLKMKDEAQQHRAEKLKGMSIEERLAYYRNAHQKLSDRQRRLRDIECDSEEPRR